MSNTRVEPPGMPGWLVRPYACSAGMYTSHLSPTLICCNAIIQPGMRSRRRKAGATPPRLLSNVFPFMVLPE